MDTQPSPLVLTKLHVPARRSRIIPRARLIDSLASESGMSVVLVCAPAGYGKTTLLTEWARFLQQAKTVVAWYALDAGDDDPIPFRSYLVASLIQAVGPLAGLTELAQRLRASPELDLQRILPELINTLSACGKDCVLILDDYHLIRSPAIHSAMAYLIEHQPENLRIAIGSRSDPPLPLARLRARGRLFEVRTVSLRFTEEEAGQFLNEAMRLQLSQAGVAALETRTEGWIAGLQLASLSIQAPVSRPDPAENDRLSLTGGLPGKENVLAPERDLSMGRDVPEETYVSEERDVPEERVVSEETYVSSFSGSHRYLVEYLMEEVLNRQTEEVQTFLLVTSILERMSAPLCEAILAAAQPEIVPPQHAGGSEAILQHLENANLFVVALDEQGTWYRYHHLFRDFLQARLGKSRPGVAAALHGAASAWFAQHGLLREAAAHAFMTRDWEAAAAFVEQHSFTLIIHSEIATIYEWCSPFPEEVIQAHPMLCIMQALALAYSFRRQNRARVEARLKQAGRIIPRMENGQDLNEFAAIVRTFMAMAPDPAADARELLVVAKDMLSHYPQSDPGQFSGTLLAGYATMALLDIPAAAQSLETARELALRGGLFFGVVESTFHLARLTHSQGRLRDAAKICRQGQADIAAMLPHPGQDLPALGCLDIALGCVLVEQDQLEEAGQRLRRGLNQMGAGMNPHYVMTAHLALFRLHEVLGRSAEALAYLDRLETLWPDIAFCTRGLRVLHALRGAPQDPVILDEASQWCLDFSPTGADLLPGLGPFGAADAYYLAGLAWMRAQVALGNGRFVEPYLERQRKLALEQGLQNRVIELSLVEAELVARTPATLQDKGRAWAALERALAAARPEGYVRSFDQGVSLNRLLAEAVSLGIGQPYARQVLTAIVGSQGTAPAEQALAPALPGPASTDGLVESLTGRELEVLRLMAQGATNQAIADHLVITVGTVKSHINHILGKLAAQNRTEAVAKARELGLLKAS